ncbi:MAG TPA: 3-keto-5-aminohexanoate cleavage protein [Thermotogota bacterium]|nr:3-keto-5-aminohexanoate cleavage protein [Thermotogota bacterium]HRW91559.1 3-keto-5-aminohexanoate cleavage protein [Thermotogota bacterium]
MIKSFDPVIITAAICGAEVTREHTPHLPLTPEELAQEALFCWQAGASIVHLHVRDEKGQPTQDAGIFQDTVSRIRKLAPALIVQVSTGGALWMSSAERLQSLESEPDMATLSTGTCNFGADVFSNPRDQVIEFAARMKEKGIMPEFECFDVGHVSLANWLVKKGHVCLPHYHYDFVMGVPGAIEGSVDNLVRMVQSVEVDQPHTWCVAGVGRREIPLAAASLAMGGHVRVGMEDNIYLSKGVLVESNAQLVEKVVRLAKEMGRPIASSKESRELFHLPAAG